MSLFGNGNSGGYSQATIDKIKTNLHILLQNLNLHSRQIQDQFALTNLTRVELGDHKKLLHTLDMTPPQLQQRFDT